MITGICAVALSSFNVLQRLTPSSAGLSISKKMTSGVICSICATPSSLVIAEYTVIPWLCKNVVRAEIVVGLFSITTMEGVSSLGKVLALSETVGIEDSAVADGSADKSVVSIFTRKVLPELYSNA